VERNVLEWRFDPRSPARLPQASYHVRVIVMCVEGYTSSLAAASLQDLGVAGATDLAGGFRAWQRAGLPVVTVPGGPGSVAPGSVAPGSVAPVRAT
jgi:3-mercaptopyruvate sulfurtransferase SseA